MTTTIVMPVTTPRIKVDAVHARHRFLDRMNQGWNISLFHYRNHGADCGRVLVGIQLPPEIGGEFSAIPAPPREKAGRKTHAEARRPRKLNAQEYFL